MSSYGTGAPNGLASGNKNPYQSGTGSPTTQAWNTIATGLATDEYGVSWNRNPLDPMPEGNYVSSSGGYAGYLKWYLWDRSMQVNGKVVNNAISTPFAIHVVAGDPTLAFSANQIYFQLFDRTTLPTNGTAAKYWWPVPPIPGVLSIDFRRGWDPFLTGLTWAFSSTIFSYTTNVLVGSVYMMWGPLGL